MVVQSSHIFITGILTLPWQWDLLGSTLFKLTLHNCIVKSSNKISLLLVSPKCMFSWAWGSKTFEFLHAGNSWCIVYSKLRYLVRATYDNETKEWKMFFEKRKLNPTNKSYGSITTVIANLIFMANTWPPDFKIYRIQ